MNPNTLQLGFIGGAIDSAVGTTHKIASQMDRRWSLRAGCFSTESSINHQTSELWGIDRDKTYSSWQELIENEKDNLDAISILTPTPQHKEIVDACLASEIPVICEKSLSCT
ncbi:MAG: Gfo/Idh/MocA family oxidoreductase, partial [Pseudomonadota bacterium]